MSLKSRYEATLNNVKLSDVNSSLLILDIQYPPPEFQHRLTTLAGRDGAMPTSRYKSTAEVKIPFELRIYDTAARQAALQDVIKWARAGGTLKTSDRSGQRLRCECTTLPSVESVKNWLDPLTVGFTAYKLPYWEENTAATLTLTGSSRSGNLTIPGDGDDAFVSVSVVPSGTLTDLTVTAGTTYITLAGLNVSSGSTVTIDYSNDMILRIKNGSTSLMAKRTAASSDDLRVPSGASGNFSLTANVSCTATFTVRGLWE